MIYRAAQWGIVQALQPRELTCTRESLSVAVPQLPPKTHSLLGLRKKKKKKKTARQSEKSGVIKKNAKMECKLQEMTASKRKNIARAKNGVHKQ